MGIPQTTDVIPFPVPTGGINLKDPLPRMDPVYSPWMKNIEVEEQYVRVRDPIHFHAKVTGDERLVGLCRYGRSKLFALGATTSPTDANIYDVTTAGGADVVSSALGAVNPDEGYDHYHAGSTYFMTDYAAGANNNYYNGSAWANWGFTTSGPSGLYGVTNYKGRAYYFQDSNLYYSGIGAVTGATTAVDMTGLFREGIDNRWIGILGSPSNKVDETYIAFGNDNGEILVYGGDSPAANNWGMVGHFKVSPILHHNAILEYNNDLWIATTTGIISLRRLFAEGDADQDRVSVSRAINPHWNKVVTQTGIATLGTSMDYWPERNRVYVLARGYIDEDGAYDSTSASLYVYNGFSGAWSLHEITDDIIAFGDGRAWGYMTYFNNAMYFISGTSVMTILHPDDYADNYFRDEEWDNAGTYHNISYELRSVYNNLNSPYRKKIVKGWEPHIETDFTASGIKMKSASDFGRKVSGAASGHFNSANGTLSHHLPFYSVGVQGNYLQYRLYGDADSGASKGLKLYAMGVGVE